MIRKVSKKQAKKNNELTKVYKELDREHREQGTFFCSGCGRSGNPLTHSHTIPRSRRPDLVSDKRNITLKCIACHDLWETHSLEKMKKLFDFNKLMGYIKEVDEEYYNILMNKE